MRRGTAAALIVAGAAVLGAASLLAVRRAQRPGTDWAVEAPPTAVVVAGIPAHPPTRPATSDPPTHTWSTPAPTASVTPELTPVSVTASLRSGATLPPEGAPACPTDLADTMIEIEVMLFPWFEGWRWSTCLVEARLAAVHPERYNTPTGERPQHRAWESPDWQTYIPLGFDIERVFRCDRTVTGFVVMQRRQLWRQPDPDPDPGVEALPKAHNQARWLVRPDSLHARPLGLADVELEEPPRLFSGEDRHADAYMFQLARSLSAPGRRYMVSYVLDWHEYVGSEALACGWRSEERLPISELLCQVEAALALTDPRWDEPTPDCRDR